MTEENNVPAEQEFDLDSAFDQAFDKASNPNKFMEEVAPKPEKKEELSESIKAEEEDEPEAEDEPVVEIKEKPSSKKADAELKVAFEKLEKSYKDTQKAFHEDRKKLSAYKRAIKSFVDEGTLTDDEAQTLLDHVHFESSPDFEEPTPSSNNGSGLAKYAKTIDKELQIMRKYSSNPEEIEINTQAFQHLFDTSSWQEKKNILDELSGFEDDDVELTKQMLLLGAQHNNEVYSEIHESGGVKQLKEKYINEIETLKKELDKSKKQYVKLKEKYEDYNEPTVIASPGGSSTASSSKSDAIDIDAALDYAFRGK